MLPFAVRKRELDHLGAIPRAAWLQLIALGVLFYTVTQGAHFLSLVYLPAVPTSLLLSFTPAFVALLGVALLGERLTARQWGGTGLYLLGVVVFFFPAVLPGREVTGLLVASMGPSANALSSILGRSVNRGSGLERITITVLTMGVGGISLLVSEILVQGLPRLTVTSWLIVFWLATVNSAFAFTLWNHTLRTLTAAQSSIINNTMLIQIALLAWAFLGEHMTGREIIGLVLAAFGMIIVQLCTAD